MLIPVDAQIEKNFTYHPPSTDSVFSLVTIRNSCKSLALLINELVPDSREKSLAMTNLEQVIMWANAGIVRNQ